MRPAKLILPRGSMVKKHSIKVIIVIAIAWTVVDFLLFIFRWGAGNYPFKYTYESVNATKIILLRELNVFFISLIICYFLITVLRNFLHDTSLWFNLFIKTLLLVFVAILMNFFIYFTYSVLIDGKTATHSINTFLHTTFHWQWFWQKMPEWIILFLFTQLAIEVNEKYSTGVFFDIMLGKYLQPKEENRIIIFIDLKNSTPIAEKLGSKEYFQFIRDVIFCISAGLMEHDGRIYQYEGDEVVAWWPHTKQNAKKVIASMIEARKVVNKNLEVFKRNYETLPEYKAGIHTGLITIGQVGIAKKELVMSGDTINTASRIRSACNDLNQKFLASKEFIELVDMQNFQTESMGMIDLKGKNQTMELFALKI